MFIVVTQTQYRLFDDPNNNGSTWSALGLSEGHFTRKEHTVKAKLENGLKIPIGNISKSGVLGDERVNIQRVYK